MADDKEKLVTDGSDSNPGRIYAGKHVRRLGIAQIVIGCLVVAAQIVVLAMYNLFFNSISHGIWCGAAFIVSGVIGILAGKRGTTCLITAHLVLCILACIFSAVIISMSALTSVYNYGSPYNYYYDPCPPQTYNQPPYHNHDYPDFGQDTPAPYKPNDYWNSYYNGYGSSGYYRSPCYDHGHYYINVPWVVQFSMNLFMGVMGIVIAILSLVAATLSCVPLCCNPFKQQKNDGKKELLVVTSQGQEQEAGPLPVKVAPIDFFIVASNGSSHI